MSRKIKKNNNRKFHSKPFRSTVEEVHQREVLGTKYVPAFSDAEFLIREELRPVRLQLELLKPELVFQDFGIEETMVFFGSARLFTVAQAKENMQQAKAALANDPENKQLQRQLRTAQCMVKSSVYVEEATKLAYLCSTDSDLQLIVVTGGGPGVMEAANKGAYQAKAPSVSLNITLLHEQQPNPYVTPELTFQFHYFAIRKMHFLIRAKALAAFPGGFGTLDELFEVLTLMQTEKIERIPLLLFGKNFWERVVNFSALVEEGTIDAADLDLIYYVETAEEGWQAVKQFYGDTSNTNS